MVPGIAACGTSSDVGPKLSKGKSTSHIKGMQSGKKEEQTIQNKHVLEYYFISSKEEGYLGLVLPLCRFGAAEVGSVESVKGIKPNFQPVRNKKIVINTCQRKTITHIRKYLRSSTIYLYLWSCRDITIIRKEYRVQLLLRLQYFLSI